MRFKFFPSISVTESPYSLEETAPLDLARVPRHIAFVMDGNRRWAQNRGRRHFQGHLAGLHNLSEIVRACSHLGVEYVTAYGFSTENWSRPDQEIAGLFSIIRAAVSYYGKQMAKAGLRFRTIGDLSRFPSTLADALRLVEELTSGCQGMTLTIALNYGGRDDVRRAALRISDDLALGRLERSEVTEERFASYLDTAGLPDPDLFVRTSGETRLSNFLLWQISYSEIVFTDFLWPDFGPKELLNVVRRYQERDRRFGR